MDIKPKKHVFTGTEGGPIALETAAAWTKNHREKHPDQPISHFSGKQNLEKILAQEGCVGLRFYHAYDEKGQKHLVIAGVNSHGDDQADTAHHGMHMLLDQTVPCPGPNCPKGVLAGQ